MADVIFNNTFDILFYNTQDVIWKRNPPTMRTYPITNLEGTSVMGHGATLDLGGENSTRRGFCYRIGSAGDPTISDLVVFDDGSFGLEAFQKLVAGLNTGNQYGIRAYAVNSDGVGYGLTLFFESGGTLTILFRDIITPIKIKQATSDARIRQVLCTPISLQEVDDMLPFSPKQNYEEYYVAFNFVRVITPLTSIATTDVFVFDESNVDVTSTLTDASKLQVSGTKVYVWVRGGSEQVYKITCKITMTNGEKFEQDASIEVTEV